MLYFLDTGFSFSLFNIIRTGWRMDLGVFPTRRSLAYGNGSAVTQCVIECIDTVESIMQLCAHKFSFPTPIESSTWLYQVWAAAQSNSLV